MYHPALNSAASAPAHSQQTKTKHGTPITSGAAPGGGGLFGRATVVEHVDHMYLALRNTNSSKLSGWASPTGGQAPSSK